MQDICPVDKSLNILTVLPFGVVASHEGFFFLTEYVFTNPSTLAACDTTSLFKQSLTGLNTDFFLLLILSVYLPVAGGEILGFITFLRVLVLCKMKSARLGFELLSLFPFPTTITITLRALTEFE